MLDFAVDSQKVPETTQLMPANIKSKRSPLPTDELCRPAKQAVSFSCLFQSQLGLLSLPIYQWD